MTQTQRQKRREQIFRAAYSTLTKNGLPFSRFYAIIHDTDQCEDIDRVNKSSIIINSDLRRLDKIEFHFHFSNTPAGGNSCGPGGGVGGACDPWNILYSSPMNDDESKWCAAMFPHQVSVRASLPKMLGQVGQPFSYLSIGPTQSWISSVSLRSFFLGQILRFCAPMVPVYTAVTLLLACGGQLSSLLKSGQIMSASQAMGGGLKPHQVNLPVYVLHLLLRWPLAFIISQSDVSQSFD